MYFQFGTRKIVEAAAVLLRSSQHGRMGRLRLLKLLYIADRESLRETGRPIVGTKLVAMDLGPVHSEVYDLIKGARAWVGGLEPVHQLRIPRPEAGGRPGHHGPVSVRG